MQESERIKEMEKDEHGESGSGVGLRDLRSQMYEFCQATVLSNLLIQVIPALAIGGAPGTLGSSPYAMNTLTFAHKAHHDLLTEA